MSSTRSSTKRKRMPQQQSEESSSPVDASRRVTLFRGWLDEGSLKPDGRIDHEAFSLSIGEDEVLEVSIGDAVLMRNASEETSSSSLASLDDSFDYYGSRKASDPRMIARVERIWEEECNDAEPGTDSNSSRFQFLARWFLKKEDVESMNGHFSGVESAEDFVSVLSDRDLVLGNQADPNPLTSICGSVQLVYRRPDSDKELPPMPSNTYVCRYTARIGEDAGDVEVTPFAGTNDEWSDYLTQDDQSDENLGKIGSNRSGSNSVCSASSSNSEGERKPERPQVSGVDEGSTEKRDIRVGPGHQAIVPAFTPGQKSVSRNPTMVWRQGGTSEVDLHDFLSRAAGILSPFLRSNRLTHNEPYSPLQWERMETLYDSLEVGAIPTLSTVCTASSLSGSRIDMLRECDSDAILAILHEKNYIVEDALTAIEANPRGFLTVWSSQEKELFNSGFRRYSGSLRMIYKGIAPSKDFKQVIDYHYRFKIPDQFRCFQDTKREQAVRMMECIETRRNISAGIQHGSFGQPGTESGTKRRIVESEWPKTGIADVARAVEDRRKKAKKLLLDVEAQMGKDKLAEIIDAIKRSNERSQIADLKAVIFDVCSGHPDFKQRLLEFLPKRFA